ncbi:MAG: GNAT family N-acetyltransferase [bacterium]|nr:GNAT family N-acetyltransferase [bacterium]
MDEARTTIQELTWDSEQFGIRVGEIRADATSRSAVKRCLDTDAGAFDLVYVRCARADLLDAACLDAFNGQLADERATFSRRLDDLPPAFTPDATGEVRSVGTDEAAEDLVALAPQAAEHSRFRADERFPSAWTDDLYRAWMHNSLSRERADHVLAFFADEHARGFYTIRVQGETGNLELFAVDQPWRGKGIGRALLVAGLRFMEQRGLVRATVTTQHRNPACRLYRTCGYSLERSEAIFHLWPHARRPRLSS